MEKLKNERVEKIRKFIIDASSLGLVVPEELYDLVEVLQEKGYEKLEEVLE